MREPNLLAWQWSLYSDGHRDRRNLLVHILTVPLFISGTLTLLTAPLTRNLVQAACGLLAMVFAMVMQGRTHRLERQPPVPFEGPLDVAGRIFSEQWITFPRYVLSGRFFEAWRQAKPSP